MPKVAIVTDSQSSLPRRLIGQYGIRIVPITICVDGRTYMDEVDLTVEQVRRRFDRMARFTTGTPSPGFFAGAFREAAAETNDVACALLSAAMSGTYDSAVRGREIACSDNPKLNIEIVDSRTSIGGVGFIALEGARAAAAGKDLGGVVAVMRDMVGRVRWLNGLDTTARVSRNGRVPESVSRTATLHEMRIIGQTLGTGRVEDFGKCEGREELFRRMVEIVGEKSAAGLPLHVIVHYMNRIEDGRRLLRMVKAAYRCVETYLAPYPASIAGLAGPSTGISFFSGPVEIPLPLDGGG